MQIKGQVAQYKMDELTQRKNEEMQSQQPQKQGMRGACGEGTAGQQQQTGPAVPSATEAAAVRGLLHLSRR